MVSNLALDSRAGLPDDLAYLRDAYPAEHWRGHANFGQLCDFWLTTHASLRDNAVELAAATAAFREGARDAAGFQRFFVPRLNHFLQHLDGHHRIEDGMYFPRFQALDPRMVAGFDLLESDHALIHNALVASAGSAQALLDGIVQGHDAARRAADAYATDADRLLTLLQRHLADEEDLIVPAMLHHGERRVS